MKDRRRETGREGEYDACLFLAERGHAILERNYRCGHLEIDIISMAEDGLHFVEVKTRRPPMQARPEENVRADKQRRLAKAALGYLHRAKSPEVRDAECHFDIVSVVIEDTKTSIEYIPDAFIPIYT